MIKNLPNFITCVNLIFGCLGLLLLCNGNIEAAAMCIWASAIADFFDGFVARAVNANSLMGKELDSLADVVSFGVLPAFIWFYYITQSLNISMSIEDLKEYAYLPLGAFFMAACSAWRLAKFNIDDRQTDHFRGVPTPANALVWSAIPFIYSNSYFSFAFDLVGNTIFIVVVGVFLSLLLVSDIPLIAFKFKEWSFKANKIKYLFLLFTLASIVILGANAVFLILILYIGASYLEHKGLKS